MPIFAYVNGRYSPHGAAHVPIDDRGYQFADAVYEVIAVIGGELVDEVRHLARLARSLGELRIPLPRGERALGHIMRRLVRLNRVREGIVYLQISRGVAPRDHLFPVGAVPQLVITARRKPLLGTAGSVAGVSVVTIPDIRWGRCDIKSTALLANVLGKQAARDAGAYEAWQVADGLVTEGTTSNAWIVTATGAVVTRRAGPEILNGVTRQVVLDLARELGLDFEQRPFSVAEAATAREAFITGTTVHVLPVVRIDGAPVGQGAPGPFTLRLRGCYLDRLTRLAAQGPDAAP